MGYWRWQGSRYHAGTCNTVVATPRDACSCLVDCSRLSLDYWQSSAAGLDVGSDPFECLQMQRKDVAFADSRSWVSAC